MKLKKILPYLDACTTVRIFQNVSSREEQWEIVYEGPIFDIPWTLLKYHLIEMEDNEDSEAICPYTDDKGNACLRITLGD